MKSCKVNTAQNAIHTVTMPANVLSDLCLHLLSSVPVWSHFQDRRPSLMAFAFCQFLGLVLASLFTCSQPCQIISPIMKWEPQPKVPLDSITPTWITSCRTHPLKSFRFIDHGFPFLTSLYFSLIMFSSTLLNRQETSGGNLCMNQTRYGHAILVFAINSSFIFQC